MPSTQFARHRDPQEVLFTFNQMMADLAGVLRRFDGQVSSYRGDGFLALFRGVHAGQNHAVRAVEAALDLIREVDRFNEPRQLLNLLPLVVRIGVATGELCFGNVGTYDKMDFTVVGTPANLGARLEGIARPGQPCISDVTREAIGRRFLYTEDSPVETNANGLGKQRAWFVAGRYEARHAERSGTDH